MNGSSIGRRFGVALAATLLALAVSTASGRASSSCGVVTAAGHSWIVVTKGIPCSSATRAVRGLSARTAAVRTGHTVTVTSPIAGLHCVLASHGKPGGSCSNAGASKSILWLAA